MFHCAVRNAALDIVRNRKRYVPVDEQRVPDQEMFRDAMVAEEEAMSLSEAMEGLPYGDQQILRMHYIEGLSHEQIAERLGVPKTTVNMRLAKARRRLKEKLLESGAFAAA
jgi:RNA polymerase sigma factor, sigma-70 family